MLNITVRLERSTVLSILVLMMSTSSCRINGSFQGLYSYQEKTAEIDPSLIQMPTVPVCSLVQLDTPVVYATNGIELRKCIESFEKSIVYIWRPKCSSDICVSPQTIQSYCEAKNIELFIVAEYYDYESMTLNHVTNRPILGIDCQYYSTHLTKKYIALFLSDLVGPEYRTDNYYLMVFEYGCLTDWSDRLDKLKI